MGIREEVLADLKDPREEAPNAVQQEEKGKEEQVLTEPVVAENVTIEQKEEPEKKEPEEKLSKSWARVMQLERKAQKDLQEAKEALKRAEELANSYKPVEELKKKLETNKVDYYYENLTPEEYWELSKRFAGTDSSPANNATKVAIKAETVTNIDEDKVNRLIEERVQGENYNRDVMSVANSDDPDFKLVKQYYEARGYDIFQDFGLYGREQFTSTGRYPDVRTTLKAMSASIKQELDRMRPILGVSEPPPVVAKEEPAKAAPVTISKNITSGSGSPTKSLVKDEWTLRREEVLRLLDK